MKSLILKEWYSLKNMGGKIYFVFVAICLLYCSIADRILLMTIVPSIVIQIIFTNMNSDINSGWNTYSAVLPIERRTMITVKYISVIFFTVLSFILIAVAITLRNCIYTDNIPYDVLCLLLLSPLSSVVMPAIDIPITIKFGMERGAAVQFMLLFALLIPMFFITDKTGEEISPDIKTITPYFGSIFPIVLIISVLFLAISWFISVKLFEKKDL